MACGAFPSLSSLNDKLVFETSNFSLPNSRHKRVVADHYFNRQVDLLLPNVGNLPKELSLLLSDEDCFFTSALPLTALIAQDFIEAFIKKGQLCMVSVCQPLDQGTVVALLPTGKLILNVTKDTYQSLGLVGQKSCFSKKIQKSGKFVVEIDLCATSFVPSKKGYQRVLQSFTDHLPMSFTFVYQWTPDSEILDGVSCVSLPQYFHSLGFSWKEMFLEWDTTYQSHCTVLPSLAPSGYLGDDPAGVTFEEFYDWIGAAACHMECEPFSADNYLSTFALPERTVSGKGLLHCRIKGLITPHLVTRILSAVRDYMDRQGLKAGMNNSGDTSNQGNVNSSGNQGDINNRGNISNPGSTISIGPSDWVSLSVHGLNHSPVSWASREHGFLQSGDNSYTYIVLPEENYWLYFHVGQFDICP